MFSIQPRHAVAATLDEFEDGGGRASQRISQALRRLTRRTAEWPSRWTQKAMNSSRSLGAVSCSSRSAACSFPPRSPESSGRLMRVVKQLNVAIDLGGPTLGGAAGPAHNVPRTLNEAHYGTAYSLDSRTPGGEMSAVEPGILVDVIEMMDLPRPPDSRKWWSSAASSARRGFRPKSDCRRERAGPYRDLRLTRAGKASEAHDPSCRRPSAE